MSRNEKNIVDPNTRVEAIQQILSLVARIKQDKLFFQGVALGLFYGIAGNILVSHYHQVFEGTIGWQFGDLFWANLIALVAVSALVGIISRRYFKKYKTLRTAEHELEDIVNSLAE